MVEQGRLHPLATARHTRRDLATIEAIIGPTSPLIGTTARDYSLFERTGLDLLAVSRRERRFSERLRDIRLEPGDVILVPRRPRRNRQPAARPRPAAARRAQPATGQRARPPAPARSFSAPPWLVTALGWVPVPVAFFAAAVLIVVTGALPLRDIYRQARWPDPASCSPALIPVSDSLRTTGATDLIANGLSQVAPWACRPVPRWR